MWHLVFSMFYKTQNKKSKNTGSLLVEVLLAVFIVTVALVGASVAVSASIETSRLSLRETQATYLLAEGAEAVRMVRDNNWTTFAALTLGTTYYPTYSSGWALSTTPNTVDGFTRTVVFSAAYRDSNDDLATSGTLDPRSKKVTVTVSWDGGASSKSISFYLMDIFT